MEWRCDLLKFDSRSTYCNGSYQVCFETETKAAGSGYSNRTLTSATRAMRSSLAEPIHRVFTLHHIYVSASVAIQCKQSDAQASEEIVSPPKLKPNPYTLIIAVYLDLAVNGMQHQHSTFQKPTHPAGSSPATPAPSIRNCFPALRHALTASARPSI